MFDLFMNQTKILNQLGGIWLIMLLVFSRVIAFSSTCPLLGHKSVTAMVRVGVSILLTLFIMPSLESITEYPNNGEFIYLIVINVFIGLLMGWVANLVMEIGRAGGEMVDTQMGLNAATVFDPGTQTQTTIIGRFFEYLTLTLFISIGGIEKLIEGLYKSYNTFPVIVHSIKFDISKIISATGDVLAMGFIIVSPIIMTILVLDLILGIMSRAAPQINAFQVSYTIKPTVGLLLLLLLLTTFMEILTGLFNNQNRMFF